MLVCRHQAFVAAPVAQVWELVGNPERHPEWWPELVAVQGRDFGRGCTYCHVTREEHGLSETKLVVEEIAELKELRVRCAETGLYMRWLLSEAQGGTFVDAEFGIERAPGAAAEPEAGATRRQLRGWLHSSLDGLAAAGGR